MSGRMSFDDGLGIETDHTVGHDGAFAIGTEDDVEDDSNAKVASAVDAREVDVGEGVKDESDKHANVADPEGKTATTKKKVYDENGNLVVEGDDVENVEQTGAASVLGVEQLDSGLKAASDFLTWGFARARAASEQVATAVVESDVGKSVLEAAEKAKDSDTYKAAANAATAVAERTSVAASVVNERAKAAAEAAAPHLEAARLVWLMAFIARLLASFRRFRLMCPMRLAYSHAGRGSRKLEQSSSRHSMKG